MIKANELRIGSKIQQKKTRGLYICYVIEILEKGINVKAKGQFGEWFLRFEEIEPIPLSEEILLKCGFEKISEYIFSIEIDNGWHLNIESNYIFLKYQDNECEISHFKFEYIHQLQNLYFALTGTELNIEL